jgi:hypothetical protein
VLLHDRTTGTTSGFIPPLAQVFGSSGLPALSADGLVVAFSSGSSMLVPDDTNWVGDVFVYDQARATTTRVSVASSGVEGNRDSGLDGPSLTADGRFVAFSSHATNLVPGDANGWNDVFVHDRARRLTTRVAPPAELEAAGVYQGSRRPAMSADGRVIAFEAQARNPAPRGEGPTYFTYVYVAELPFGEDVPVPARYWGPPAAALAAFRPSTGAWWLDRPGDQGPAAIPWGAAALGDVPVPADYDGDGHADIAVFRRFSGEWFILPSSGAG